MVYERKCESKGGKMTNRPVKKWKSGSIEAAIWYNEKEINGNLVGFKTVSLGRSFKKKNEDIWRNEAVNMRRNDLQKAILVLQKAQEEMLLNEEKEDEEDEE